MAIWSADTCAQTPPSLPPGEIPPFNNTTFEYAELYSCGTFSIIVPSTIGDGWWRDQFICAWIDDDNWRAERYRTAFFAAILQPKLTARLTDEGQLFTAQRDLARDTGQILAAGSDLAEFLSHVFDGGDEVVLHQFANEDLMGNWGKIVRNPYIEKAFSVLGPVLSSAGIGVSIATNASDRIFLHGITNAAALERLDALNRFVAATSPSDPAVAEGLRRAELDVKAFQETGLSILGDVLASFTASEVNDAVRLVAGLAEHWIQLSPTVPLSQLVLPYYLAMDITIDVLADLDRLQAICAAATIDRMLMEYRQELEQQLISGFDLTGFDLCTLSYEEARRELLTIEQVRYGIGYWYNSKYDEILELNLLSPWGWIVQIVQVITGTYDTAQQFREEVLQSWVETNYQNTLTINEYLAYRVNIPPRITAMATTPVDVATAPPTVSGTVMVTADVCDDREIEEVTLLADGIVVGAMTDDGAGHFSASWDTSFPGSGERLLTVRATDAYGLETTRESRLLVYVPCDLSTDDYWTATSCGNVTLEGVLTERGQAVNGAQVCVTVGSAPEKCGVTNEEGRYSISVQAPCGPGSYEVMTSAFCANGEASALGTLTVNDASPGLAISCSITPSTIPVDGQSYARVTATVTEDGQPVSGADVTFATVGLTLGAWVDCATGELAAPNNGPADSSGHRVSCFRPNTIQTCTLSASVDNETSECSFEGVAPSGLDPSVWSSRIARADSYADFEVGVIFRTQNGGIVDDGQAEVCVDGLPGGSGFPSDGGNTRCITKTIDYRGKVILRLQILGSCPADVVNGILTIKYLPTGEEHLRNIQFAVCDPRVIDSGFQLRGSNNGLVQCLDIGTHYLATVELAGQLGSLIAWDTRTWKQVGAVRSEDLGNDQDDWKYATVIAVSKDDSKVIVPDDNGIALFNVSSSGCSLACADDHPDYRPNRDVALGTGMEWVAIDDTDNAPQRIDIYTGCRWCRTVVTLPGDSRTFGQGIAWSPDGGRIAYSYRATPDECVAIRSAPSCSSPGSPVRTRCDIGGGVQPGGVAWSVDGGRVAVIDGNYVVRIFDASGNDAAPVSRISLPDNAQSGAGLSWSKLTTGVEYLAVYTDTTGVSIYNMQTGIEQVRCNMPHTASYEMDTVAWREDGRVLVATHANDNNIRIFAPFDSEQPELSVTAPQDGFLTDAATITVTGTASDDTGLFPGSDGAPGGSPSSLLWRLDAGGWQESEYDNSGNFSFDVNVGVGAHIFELELTDLAGKKDGVSINVERVTPPALTARFGQTPISNGQIEPIDFGITNNCQSGPTRVFTVCSTGGMPLNLGSVSVPTGYQLDEPLDSDLSPGRCDEFTVRLAGAAGTGTRAGSVSFSTGVAGSDPFSFPVTGVVENGAVEILVHPEDAMICEGAAATFRIEATGAPPLLYQWMRDDHPILGAVASEFTTGLAGSYYCTVANGCGSHDSEIGGLIVNTAPVVSSSPASADLCVGESHLLQVAATGSPEPSFQWRKDGWDIDGENGDSYPLDSVNVQDAGAYDVVVANLCGTVTSEVATISVSSECECLFDEDCDDGLECTNDFCNVVAFPHVCDHLVMSGQCLIDDMCRLEGELNPGNGCETCDPVRDSRGWSHRPEGAVCGDPPVLVCDALDTCDDAGSCVEVVEASGVECRPAVGPCDEVESCDGLSPECPLDLLRPDGTPCNDEVFCNGLDQCSAGTCSEHTGNPCPTDTCCNETNDACGASVPCSSDPDCDDGDSCNGIEECVQACCQNGTPPSCNDGNACTEDECLDGECVHSPVVCDDTFCGDYECDPNGEVGNCDILTPLVPDGTACDDGDSCTSPDTCSDGTCTGTPSPDPCCGDPCCGDPCCGDPCCGDPCCGNPDPCCGVDCDDGSFCNGVETCVDGNCEDGEPPCAEDLCDEVNDECPPCNAEPEDGKIVICHLPPGNPDNPQTLVIAEPALNAHLRHGDYEGACNCPCTSNDTCPASQACGTDDVCGRDSDEDGIPDKEDECPNTPPSETPNGQGCSCTQIDCNDGDACNGLESCENGACVFGTPLDCDDNNLCTDDSCDPISGCVNTLIDCDDGEFCNGPEICVDGECQDGIDPCDPDTQLCDEETDECKPDSDGDGVSDDDDECPGTPPRAEVGPAGCRWFNVSYTHYVLGQDPGPSVATPDVKEGDAECLHAVREGEAGDADCIKVEAGDPDVRFDEWEGSGVPAGEERTNPLTITMDENKTIMARFEKAGGGGGGSTGGPCGSMGSGCGPTGPATILILLGMYVLRFVGPGRSHRP